MSDPSNGGDFVPPGTFAMSGDILDCGWGVVLLALSRGQGCAGQSTMPVVPRRTEAL